MSSTTVYSGSSVAAINASSSAGPSHRASICIWEVYTPVLGQSGSINWTARLEGSSAPTYSAITVTELRTGFSNITASVVGLYRVDSTGLELRPVVFSSSGLIVTSYISNT